jgi:hypothetical protein
MRAGIRPASGFLRFIAREGSFSGMTIFSCIEHVPSLLKNGVPVRAKPYLPSGADRPFPNGNEFYSTQALTFVYLYQFSYYGRAIHP